MDIAYHEQHHHLSFMVKRLLFLLDWRQNPILVIGTSSQYVHAYVIRDGIS